MLLAGADEAAAGRAAESVLRDLEAALAGYIFALGRSRIAETRSSWPAPPDEALLAANVAEGDAASTARWRSSRPAPTGCCSPR